MHQSVTYIVVCCVLVISVVYCYNNTVSACGICITIFLWKEKFRRWAVQTQSWKYISSNSICRGRYRNCHQKCIPHRGRINCCNILCITSPHMGVLLVTEDWNDAQNSDDWSHLQQGTFIMTKSWNLCGYDPYAKMGMYGHELFTILLLLVCILDFFTVKLCLSKFWHTTVCTCIMDPHMSHSIRCQFTSETWLKLKHNIATYNFSVHYLGFFGWVINLTYLHIVF